MQPGINADICGIDEVVMEGMEETAHVFPFVEEAESFSECDHANRVESVTLKPVLQVDSLVGLSHSVKVTYKQVGTCSHKGLEMQEARHGVEIGDFATQLGMAPWVPVSEQVVDIRVSIAAGIIPV